jgi:hypothetical protein
MSLENRLWGATKIHGELLKLGIDVAQSTVSIGEFLRKRHLLQSDTDSRFWATDAARAADEVIASISADPW